MRHRLLAIGAFALILAGSESSFAQTESVASGSAAVAEALARPLSPGSVALLLPYAARPEVVQRLIQALEDSRPEVRAVAARVAFTTRHTSLGPSLAAALEKETNDAAGAEIARALALIQGAAADRRIVARLGQFDSRATNAWLSTVSRVRPADAWAHLDKLRSERVGEILLDLVAAQPDAAATAFLALPRTPAIASAYLSFVQAIPAARPLPPWSVLAPGVAERRTHAALLQLLVKAEAADQPLPAEAAAVLAAAEPSPDFAWLVLYRELARRARTPPALKQSQLDTILRIDPTALPSWFLVDPWLARLDHDEVAAFRQLVGPDWAPSELRSVPGPGGPVPKLDPVEEAGGSLTRLARPLSTLLMKDLQSLLVCTPGEGNVAVVDVTYRPTGQVQAVSTVSPAARGGCAHVGAITAALDVAPGHRMVPESRVDRLVIGLRPGDLTCDRATAVAEAHPERVGRRIRAPRKTRNVAPVYPSDVVAARVQGVVLSEATITTTGCVVDAFISRRVHPALDVSALVAIGEWRYEPASLDGRVVPVIMTVTVNFTLQ
jgi:TonB family protein